MTDDESRHPPTAGERVADWAAGYAAGFAAGCDTSELGRLYQRALQERDLAETAARTLDHRLKLLQSRIVGVTRRRRHATSDEKGTLIVGTFGGPRQMTPSPDPRCCASDPGGALFEES